MRTLGEISLLTAFVGSGYAAFACIAGWRNGRRGLSRAGMIAATASLAALTVTIAVLSHALLTKDFRFHYVEQYSSRLLPWQYSLSALWVGQAGSLLLWSWLLGVLAFVFRILASRKANDLHQPAFGFLMAYVCFLLATMVFGVDPMAANLAPGSEGVGLSPLLQHPAMLIHPPVVFLAYAAWAIPFALAVSALVERRSDRAQPVNADWIRLARPWALFAWAVLGVGILLGAEWSYEELGWGGYWGWDPVENGSLIPWLTGTAFLHGLLAWQFRGILKKWTLALAIATFGLCNFATFLTRSGIFSSLHAFSKSPIGWLFLGLMIVLVAGGGFLVGRRRHGLSPEQRITSLWSRESQILISAGSLLLLAAVAIVGTTSVALSEAITGKRIVVGPAFYNNVLIPIGLALLSTVALAPLLRWGRPPTAAQRRMLRTALIVAAVVAGAAWVVGVRHPLGIAVAGLVGLAVPALLGCLWLDAYRIQPKRPWAAVPAALAAKRRQYAGFLIHLGFVSVAVGITGSALGSRQHEAVVRPGETIEWAGRSIRFVKLRQDERADKLVVEAELEIAQAGAPLIHLRPAQHLHRLQNEWTTEVAIHSNWTGDFYTILHNGEPGGAVRLTLIENPLIRWLWLGGAVIAVGAVLALRPERSRHAIRNSKAPVAEPHALKRRRRQSQHARQEEAVLT
jgi:cytochrome c-type biogenesis protein CcmF